MQGDKKRKYYFIGAGVLLFTVGMALLSFLAPAYLESFLIFSVGATMCGMSVSITADTYRCKEKVSAVMVDYGLEQFKAHVTSTPIFTYQYQGIAYTTKCAESLSQKYVLQHYRVGEVYAVYLSPKNPSFIKLTRRIRLFDAVLLLLGLAAVVLSIEAAFLIKS